MDGSEVGEVLRVFRSRAQTRAFYNKISGYYDALSDRSEAPIRRKLVSLLDPRAGERILEIGVGTGHVLEMLAAAVGEAGQVLGVDLSEEMIRISRERVAAAGFRDRCGLRRGDASRLQYAGGSMDAVCMSFTLELFDNTEIPTVLSECRRVLKAGGRLAVAGMSKEGRPDPMARIFEWGHRHFPNFLDCRPIFVRRSLEAAGFVVRRAVVRRMWVPVEIVLAVRE